MASTSYCTDLGLQCYLTLIFVEIFASLSFYVSTDYRLVEQLLLLTAEYCIFEGSVCLVGSYFLYRHLLYYVSICVENNMMFNIAASYKVYR